MVTQNATVMFGIPHYFRLGLEETIGPDELEKINVQLAGLKLPQNELTMAQVKPIRQKLDEIYGTIGARGITMCSGRAAFKHLLSQQGKQLGFESETFRFLPGRFKLKKGLSLLASWMGKNYQEKVFLESKEKHWLFSVADCYECTNINSTGSMCDFTTGFLQEFLTWASGGKFYRIQETTCRCKGDEFCSFMIDKDPVE